MGATEQSPLMTMYPPFCSNYTIDVDTLGWLPVAWVQSSQHSITKWLTPSTNTQLNAFQVPNKHFYLMAIEIMNYMTGKRIVSTMQIQRANVHGRSMNQHLLLDMRFTNPLAVIQQTPILQHNYQNGIPFPKSLNQKNHTCLYMVKLNC